ncbi:P-loop containing nucleoside triphosphate hydrolase protein [Armillaria solidipes]|uniref:P-loop containing nucleoside triphosphate hydrolase protein n=1 Tax=Armillaria solidipes TaxID=1076256 RepID=A0A2H3BJZ8_9AGAR|nr:P-loop containing nucleoside triphosphate hydrolase protein [Armillaria solidipes]
MVSPDSPANKLLDYINENWYYQATKRARWMDLIGDYAGDEPFIIDGESLIQSVLDDPLLAIGRNNDTGFQALHAIYSLENTLKSFVSRKANVEIVFWRNNTHATITPGQTPFVHSSRYLARQILLKHLQQLSHIIPTHQFDSPRDKSWKKHEASRKPMFVLISDSVPDRDNPADDLHSGYIACQRNLIFEILSFGLPVALFNGLEFRDSKVWDVFVMGALTNLSTPRSYPSSSKGHLPLGTRALLGPQSRRYMTEWISRLARNMASLRYFSVLDRYSLTGSMISSHKPLMEELLAAFLLHVFSLPELPIKARIQSRIEVPSDLQDTLRQSFLPRLFFSASAVLQKATIGLDIDLHVFFALLHNWGIPQSSTILSSIASITSDSDEEDDGEKDSDLEEWDASDPESKTNPQEPVPIPTPQTQTQLLPFSHPVFDKALSSIKISTATDDRPLKSSEFLNFSVLFTDTRHWHNSKKIITPGEKVPVANWRVLRSNQRYIANLQRQAETLTGASGRGLQQITITVDSAAPKKKPEKGHNLQTTKPVKLTKKEQLKKDIQDKKDAEKESQTRQWFLNQLGSMSDKSAEQKLYLLEQLTRSSRMTDPWVAVEHLMYKTHLLLKVWIEDSDHEKDTVRDRYTVTIMRLVKDICDKGATTPARGKALSAVLTSFGFSAFIDGFVTVAEPPTPCPLAFDFVKLVRSKGDILYPWMKITEHPILWQLRLFGPYMDRSMDSCSDRRVNFDPDAWQKKALDCIDDPNHSMLVVAPTSAGKTFISFYAMEKVLRESNDGILVYIAPTKALITQIAAEVYARFSKKVPNGSLWAVHTWDYRINEPHNCQILITVPEMLSIMLLSPPLASKWTPRIKRIVLDEIHCIGQQEGGAVWEQIILLAPCPIIGLSATIGEPETFNDWLASVSRAHGYKHTFIQHKHRYSHLRKFFYRLDGLKSLLPFQGHESYKPTSRMRFLHPLSMLAFGLRALPEDLSLEPADTLSLYSAMSRHKGLSSNLVKLDPILFFSSVKGFLRQKDILRYETDLKNHLMDLPLPSLNKVIHNLADKDIPQGPNDKEPSRKSFETGLLPLVADLHARGELPAILFNFDRADCEDVAELLLHGLLEAEFAWKSSSPQWQRKCQQWQKWQDSSKARIREENRAKKSKRKPDPADVEPSTATEAPAWESTFDPDAPLDNFSFAGHYSAEDLDKAIKGVWSDYWKSKPVLLAALRRGIAVHHSGLGKAYRSLVENLFRRGYIRVMISTGTLALGINAPTRTSVFCGDSPFLTALMSRQYAGRAGRRGYDLLGNVVFYGLTLDRVQRLVLSKLPSLGGTFPLTPTLTLRLFNLLDGSNNAKVAVNAVESLMKLPQISFGSQTGQNQLLHHLRFNIEYLRRTHLLDRDGKPINLYAVSAHLYYTEPSNFALPILLREGILHRICARPLPKYHFILLMCHFFGRRYLASAAANTQNVKKLQDLVVRFPSMIILPPLRADARKVLEEHDKEILEIFTKYTKAYTSQYCSELGPDDMLPLSGIKYIGTPSTDGFRTYLEHHIRPVSVRSSFVATSGHFDEFQSVEELVRSARSGLHLNEHAIPSMTRFTAAHGSTIGSEHALNAYLLDFFTHGQISALEEANGIRRGDVWYFLQDFMLTLMVIKSSLEQLLTDASVGSDKTVPSEDAVPSDYFMADPAETDELSDDGADAEAFKRPPGTSAKDWRMYEVVRDATAEFNEKFRSMWA